MGACGHLCLAMAHMNLSNAVQAYGLPSSRAHVHVISRRWYQLKPVVCQTAVSYPSQTSQADVSEPDEDGPSTSGRVSRFVRPDARASVGPSVRDTGTLRPAAEWYPAWMQYRRREDNYVFWQDKFVRCSADIPMVEKRWTLFSTIWFLVMEFKFFAIPPALRYLWFLAWRSLMMRAYEAHKALVLWQCKFDAYLAAQGSGGAVQTFSRTMALRRLHLKASILGDILYSINLYKTGRVQMLPPEKKPLQRPTLLWLF